MLRLYIPEVPPLSGPWALCTLFPLSGKHPSPLASGQFSFIFLCLGLTCCFWNSPVSEPSRVGPTYVPASACPRCFLGPGTQEALSKCSAKGSRTLALLLDWSFVLSSTRANHPARQTVFTNHFCVCSGSQVFTYDGQQDAAGVSAGGPETHVMQPKGDGATAVTARTARQRLEQEEGPQVMAPPPWGLRALTFWTYDLSGPSWQKERGTRSQGEEKRNPDAGSAHASTLCPAPQFPSVASARRVCVAGPMGRPPQNTPGLGHQAEPFPLTTLRGRDPQWARCTETITPSSLPKPLEITCGPSSCSSPAGRFSRPLTPRALNWGYLQYGQKASPGSLGALLTRLTPLSFPDRVRAAVSQ